MQCTTDNGTRPVESVLVIDDDEMVRKSTDRLLQTLGFHSHCVETIADAKLVLAEHIIDAILVDLQLDKANGFQAGSQLLRSAEQRRPGSRPLLIGMSGSVDINDVTGHDFDAFLSKPFSVDLLRVTLSRNVTS